MAIVDPFTPALMEKLESKGRFIEAATKAISNFARFAGPDGKYLARLARIVPSLDPKTNNSFKCIAYFQTIASLETGDQKYANYIVRIQVNCKDGKNSTEQDAWNRLYTDIFQALGCVTAAWMKRAEAENTNVNLIMKSEILRLNALKPVVLLNIAVQTNDTRYHNINIIDVMTEESVAHFTKQDIQLSDEELASSHGDDPLPLDEGVVVDFGPEYEKAEAQVRGMDDLAQLKGFILQSGINIEPSQMMALNVRSAQDTILRFICQQNGQDPDAFCPPQKTPEVADVGKIETTQLVIETTAVKPGIIEEDDEPVLPLKVESAPFSTHPGEAACQAFCQSLQRQSAQLGIQKFDPQTRFSKSVTDEQYRTQLYFMLMERQDLTDTSLTQLRKEITGA